MDTVPATSLAQHAMSHVEPGQGLVSRRIELSDPMEAMEFFYRQGWTDGLPVVPPTPERWKGIPSLKFCILLDVSLRESWMNGPGLPCHR